MSIVPQDAENEREISNTVDRFFKSFHVGKLLFRCGAGKQKGIPVMTIYRYLIMLMFDRKSMYMQLHTGSFKENFSKNTVYRFFLDARINWNRFTALLSARIIQNQIRPLTSDKRVEVFIADDSLYDRSRANKVELLARVFDHCSCRYRKGFRFLTFAWSDGSTLMPINSCLLSSGKESNRYQEQKACDRRSLAYKRRNLAQQKTNDVLIQMIEDAQKAGHTAQYMLFDSWFAAPVTIQKIKTLGLDTIAMVKKSSKVKYDFNGQNLDVKEIYSRNKKRRGRSKYLLSVDVKLGKEDPIPAKLVYVRNRSNKKDWLALICTDKSLSEEEIIRIYGRRWDIEVFFKTCKSYLKLAKECHSLSYDAMCAHTAIVMVRYMILAIEKRTNTDYRSLGEIFYFMYDEADDITFDSSLQILLDALYCAIIEVFHPTDAQMQQFTEAFINNLPEYMRKAFEESELEQVS